MTYTTRDVTIVVCAKNEEARIGACLDSLKDQDTRRIIVVDGGSTDATVLIALNFGADVRISYAGNLPTDRQIGADRADTPLVCFIDADHRLAPGDLARLIGDLERADLDVCQAGIRIAPGSFWNRAESDFLDLTHNVPGERHMIGVAPTIFRRGVFARLRFSGQGTPSIDDTDFFYRLHRDTPLRTGIGSTVITQAHEGSWRSYAAKFRWYGRGDGEFCRKHPERRASMWFHLLVRYPLIYPARAIRARRPRAALYAVAQGLLRFRALITS